MPLNQKRRLFRHGAPLSLRGMAFAARGTVLACAGGLLAMTAAGWVMTRPSGAPAQPPSATVRLIASTRDVAVIDGATLRLAGRVIRLGGIQSPPRGETCWKDSAAPRDCGVAAANALAALIKDRELDCTLQGQDGANRPIATCSTGDGPIGRAMVATGWARADAAIEPLVALEVQARAAHRGIWALP